MLRLSIVLGYILHLATASFSREVFPDLDRKCVENKWHAMSTMKRAQACLASLPPCPISHDKFSMLPACPAGSALGFYLDQAVKDMETGENMEKKMWRDQQLDPYEGDAFSIVSRIGNEVRVEMMQSTISASTSNFTNCEYSSLMKFRRGKALGAHPGDQAGHFLPKSLGGPCHFFNYVPLTKATADWQANDLEGIHQIMIAMSRILRDSAYGEDPSLTVQIWPAYMKATTGRPVWLTYVVRVKGFNEPVYAYRLRNAQRHHSHNCSSYANYDFSHYKNKKFLHCPQKWWLELPPVNSTTDGVQISVRIADVWNDEATKKDIYRYEITVRNLREKDVSGLMFRVENDGGMNQVVNLQETSTPGIYQTENWYKLRPQQENYKDVQVFSYGLLKKVEVIPPDEE